MERKLYYRYYRQLAVACISHPLILGLISLFLYLSRKDFFFTHDHRSIVLLAVFLLLLIGLGLWFLHHLFLLLRDLPTVRSGHFEAVTGTVIGYRRSFGRYGVGLRTLYPIVQLDNGERKLILRVPDTKYKERYRFYYLPHTKIAIVVDTLPAGAVELNGEDYSPITAALRLRERFKKKFRGILLSEGLGILFILIVIASLWTLAILRTLSLRFVLFITFFSVLLIIIPLSRRVILYLSDFQALRREHFLEVTGMVIDYEKKREWDEPRYGHYFPVIQYETDRTITLNVVGAKLETTYRFYYLPKTKVGVIAEKWEPFRKDISS